MTSEGAKGVNIVLNVSPLLSSFIRVASDNEAALASLYDDRDRDAAVRLSRVTGSTVRDCARYIASHGIDAYVRDRVRGVR